MSRFGRYPGLAHGPQTIRLDESTLASLAKQLAALNERRASRGRRPLSYAHYARFILQHAELVPHAFADLEYAEPRPGGVELMPQE